MAFPQTPLVPIVEISLAGTWTDITSYVYVRNGVTIARGRADEASSISPAKCQMQLNNRDGRFSPRNPMGAYYGLIGRNTPLRVAVKLGPTRLYGVGTFAAPDTAGLSVTGDLDIRADLDMPNWAPNTVIVNKYPGAGSRSYRLFMDGSGKIVFQWSNDGTAEPFATSTVPVATTTGRQAVRATIDVDNGAGGHTIVFYTAPTLAGPWTQLGDPLPQAGVTSIFDSAAPLVVGSFSGWQVYGVEVRSGIGGTVVASPDFTAQADGTTTFSDGINTWTATGAAVVTNRRDRFIGEVSTWPVTWGLDQVDVRTSIEASGITRRLGQGASPLQSPLRRGLGSLPNLVAYWPMEDEAGSTQFASAVSNGYPMTFTGSPSLAASSIIAGSAPLATVQSGSMVGYTAPAADGTIETRAVFYIPAAVPDGSVLLQLITTGTARYWNIGYFAAGNGSLGVIPYDAAGAPIAAWSAAATNVNGNRCNFSFNLTTSGGSLTYALFMENLDTGVSSNQVGGFTGTVGHAQAVTVTPGGTWGGDTVVGHVHVLSVITNGSDLTAYERGQAPETAGKRAARLAADQNLTLISYGIPGPTSGVGTFQALGPQPISTILEALIESADVDLGVLFEPRETLGLAYRARESLYNQTPVLALPYTALQDLAPVDDDQAVRNDVTVTRKGGSSVRRQLTSGALSTQAPPNGVGTYDTSVELNLYSDAYLQNQAGWRLRMGTLDETRYPVVSLNLASSAFTSSASLTGAALDIDQGDLITISGPPAWLPPEQIRQIVQGYTERFDEFSYEIEINCTPASAWDVGIYNDTSNPGTRYSSDGSTMASSAAPGATTLSVATASGPLWTTTPASFPFDLMISGERVTATACSGTSSPQTFTVTRAVNGVSKTLPSGATVALFKPAYYAL